ncbi:hypothetical protein D3C87_1017550 [compost metagenome]
MKIQQVKELVAQVKRHVPEGGKFAVYGHAALVLEGTAAECEFVAFVVDMPTHFHMRKIYGDVESRLEGEWVGNNEVRIYTGYLEARVKMVGDIPCRHEAHPDFDPDVLGGLPLPPFKFDERSADVDGDESMEDRPKRQVPDRSGAGGHDRAMRDMLRMPVIVAGEPIINRLLKEPQAFANRGIIVAPPTADLILTGKNVDFADVVGDYLGLGPLAEGMMESRSASKALLKSPISLKDTPYGGFQAYRRAKLGSSEYRARKLVLIEEDLKFTDDEVNNRRRLNNASLYLKVLYKRAVRGLDRAVAEESMTARCTQPPGGHIEPEDHTVDSIAVALGSLREMKEEGEE